MSDLLFFLSGGRRGGCGVSETIAGSEGILLEYQAVLATAERSSDPTQHQLHSKKEKKKTDQVCCEGEGCLPFSAVCLQGPRASGREAGQR